MEPGTSLSSSGIRKGPATCEICKDNPSKYMCPRCGLPYCSLTCYKNPEKHLQCSESFYKDCVVESIKSEEKKDPKSAKKMMEILERVRNQDLDPNQEDISDEGEEELDSDDDEPLQRRLEGIDLNDANEVWKHLTEDERREFQSLAKNVNLAGDIIPQWIPWWEEEVEKKMVVDLEEGEEEAEGRLSFLKFHKRQPDWLDPIPKMSDLTKVKPNQHVAKGLINVVAAYVWAARLFNGDLFDEEKVLEVASCVIYLSSFLNKDGVFKNIEHAVGDVPLNACRVPALSEGGDAIQSTLIRDIWVIIKGPKRMPSQSSSASIKLYLLSALTECYNIFIKASKILKLKSNNGADNSSSDNDDKDQSFSKLFPSAPPVVLADLKIVNKAKRKLLYLIAFANEFMEEMSFESELIA